ncbi:hypothetical protein CBR_g30319 [Chara braunii]|uniref:Nucleotide-diphospho-sugar transferase domain-containing protein n=1 Tax=Chara braunii TaxID=69332 RepID=A0A388JX53_CHABU|nr:hypothetical protein CBR_g30319 [Chara braunii]|eukprot:GBG62365.1 hypothetical protein CBR_g30319 [Chara braunii]
MVLAPRSGRRVGNDGEDTSLSHVCQLDSNGIVVLSPNLMRSQSPNVGLHARSNVSSDPHQSGLSPASNLSSSPDSASLMPSPDDEAGGRRKGKQGKYSENLGTFDDRRRSVSRPAILTVLVLLLFLFALASRSRSGRPRSRSRSRRNASPHHGAFEFPGNNRRVDIDDDGEDDEFNVHGIVEEGEGSVPKLILPRWIRRPEQGTPRVLLVSDSWLSCGNDGGVAGGHARFRRQIAENRLLYARRWGSGAMDVWMSLDRLVDSTTATHTDSPAAATSTDPGWNSVVGISNLLQTHSDYDWLLYLAPDVLVLDLDFAIPWERYVDRDLVLWGSREELTRSVGEGPGGDIAPVVVEPRVMLIRPSAWSISFVQRLMEIGGIGREGVGGGGGDAEDELKRRRRDQILEKMVQQQKMTKGRTTTAEAAAVGGGGGGGGGKGVMDGKVSPRVALTYLLKFVDGVEDVQRKVHFENSYHLSGCWESVVPHLEQYQSNWIGDGVEPPFAVTFEDCDLFCGYGVDDHRRSSSSSSSAAGAATSSACLNAFAKARAFVLNQTTSATAAAHRQRAPPASRSAASARLTCTSPRVSQEEILHLQQTVDQMLTRLQALEKQPAAVAAAGPSNPTTHVQVLEDDVSNIKRVHQDFRTSQQATNLQLETQVQAAATVTPAAASSRRPPKLDDCDQSKTEPIPWWRQFSLRLDMHHVPNNDRHPCLYHRSGGACQAWLDNILTSHGVAVSELHTKLIWQELTDAWHKRFQVEPPDLQAMDKLNKLHQNMLLSQNWIIEFQRLASIPYLPLAFRGIKHLFIMCSCPALQNALTQIAETLDTSDKLFSTALSARIPLQGYPPWLLQATKNSLV